MGALCSRWLMASTLVAACRGDANSLKILCASFVWIDWSSSLAADLAWLVVRLVRGALRACATLTSARTFAAGIISTVQVAMAAARRQEVNFTAIVSTVASVCRSSSVLGRQQRQHPQLSHLKMQLNTDHAAISAGCPTGNPRLSRIDGNGWPGCSCDRQAQPVTGLERGV